MASQNGILGLQGTVGGLVFARNGTVRQKPASNKAAFNSAASLARTRENASEFGRAGTAGKLIRTALRTLISTASDSLMVSRLTQKTRAIIGMDETNDRGARILDKDNALELVGFDFNASASLSQVFFGSYTTAAAGADLTISLPSLNGLTDVAAPQGATHFELMLGSAAINFETGAISQGAVAAPLGSLPLNGPVLVNQAIKASLAVPPTADDVVLGVLGVNFYQLLNGKQYPLNNNASNPLAIVYAD
ncbi:hypothetical protein [Hymenobacter coccineus]|uniref:Uncharacterized protein n=1 Tax=Hymenobacter coccineus TaxID=1908235 RepID=A0A1G1THW5_9BACT|nr:hypothetical protein [Hymenobacter coccineus]OGX90486.1 hypothetical protein BEN49_22695 [Hymenobacter coccineus]